MQCPDQPAVRRIVSIGTLAIAAALVDEDLILWGMKRVMSIPASPKVVLIHRDIVSLLAAL